MQGSVCLPRLQDLKGWWQKMDTTMGSLSVTRWQLVENRSGNASKYVTCINPLESSVDRRARLYTFRAIGKVLCFE